MDESTDDLDKSEEETFGYEVTDEELEAAADGVRWVWTRVTTSCGGTNC